MTNAAGRPTGASRPQPLAVVLVHGIGGPVHPSAWITPLNATLTSLRMPTIDLEPVGDERAHGTGAGAAHSGGPSVINVDYLTTLRQSANPEVGDQSRTGPLLVPPTTWQRPGASEQAAHWGAYLARQEHLRWTMEGAVKQGSRLPLADLATPLADAMPQGLPIVRRYLTDSSACHAVWRSVLAQLPTDGRLVIVAHSLGSIVMLDLLTRLPPTLHVSLLLTIGSPIGIGPFRERLAGISRPEDFPADRVGAWINAYDPDDIVTAGRGAAPAFAAALDAPVETGLSHGIAAYMSQPLVGAAIALTMFGPPSPPEQEVPARRIHPHWWPLMLRFAFTQELWRTWPTDKWAERIRMDTARSILAQRVVAQAEEQRMRMIEQLSRLPEPARSELERALAEHSVAVERRPTATALLRDAGELVSGQLTHEALILTGVELMLSPPFAPFGIEVDHGRSAQALASLYQRICDRDSGRPGAELAGIIAGAVEDARKALSRRGIPWTPLLLGAGALVLAGTGIGLAAAIPAGLAGAAAITATLAAFGPGGIAGGVATLAVLTGTSAALATAGVALGGVGREEAERLQASMAQEIAQFPPPAFRTAIAALLAVHLARLRLGLDARADELEFTLLCVQGVVLGESTLHAAIAPKADSTRQWRTKAEVLAKALEWAAGTLRTDQGRERAELARAIETGGLKSAPAE